MDKRLAVIIFPVLILSLLILGMFVLYPELSGSKTTFTTVAAVTTTAEKPTMISVNNYRLNFNYYTDPDHIQKSRMFLVGDLIINNYSADSYEIKLKLLETYQGLTLELLPSALYESEGTLCSSDIRIPSQNSYQCTFAFMIYDFGSFTLRFYNDTSDELINWQNLIYEADLTIDKAGKITLS